MTCYISFPCRKKSPVIPVKYPGLYLNFRCLSVETPPGKRFGISYILIVNSSTYFASVSFSVSTLSLSSLSYYALKTVWFCIAIYIKHSAVSVDQLMVCLLLHYSCEVYSSVSLGMIIFLKTLPSQLLSDEVCRC